MAQSYTTPPYVLELPDGSTRIVPTSWPDLTMATYSKLLSETVSADIYGLLATAAGCTRAQLLALPTTVGNQLVKLLEYLQLQPPALGSWPLPKVVHIPSLPDANGWITVRELPVPKSLAAESFGQGVDLASALTEHGQDFGELRRQALAIYLLPQYFGCPYDTDLLPAMLEAVDRIKLGEGLPLADFFILSLGESSRSTKASLSLYPLRQQNKKQGMQNLAKPGRPTRWQTLWQVGISSALGRYFYSRWGRSLRP